MGQLQQGMRSEAGTTGPNVYQGTILDHDVLDEALDVSTDSLPMVKVETVIVDQVVEIIEDIGILDFTEWDFLLGTCDKTVKCVTIL